MKNYTVVKRYARALLKLGKDDGNFVQYGQELSLLAASFIEAGPIVKAITSPAYPEVVRRKMLTTMLGKASFSPLVNNFIHLLMDKKHFEELPDIADTYNALADEERGIVRATITSALPLSDAETEAIRASLDKFAGCRVELSVDQDESIIGGVIAQMGDLTIDGSVRTQLNKLSGLLDTL